MSVVPQFRNRQFLITLTALTAAVVILLMTGLRANAVLMPDHITISPASATITAGGSQAFTAEGFNASNASLGDVTLTTTFTISPDGSCTGASCTATTAGDHTVTATNNGKTDTATLTVTAGPLDHLVLTPAAATIAAGTSQSFTAHGADIYGNSLDDVTSATAFGITPDGSCTGAGCTATTAGPHTVTGTDSTKTGTATLTVTAGSVTAAQSTVSASPASVKADGTTKSTVTVTLKDANGNPVSGKAASLSQGADRRRSRRRAGLRTRTAR